MDPALAYRLEDCAALFTGVRAGRELTLSEIFLKLGEAVLQPVLVDHLVALQINRRKARSVGNKAAVLLEQFNHARGVATSAELVGTKPTALDIVLDTKQLKKRLSLKVVSC